MSPPRAIPPRSAPRCPREAAAAATNFFAAKAARGGNQPRCTGSAAAHSDWPVRSAPPRIGPRPPSRPAPRGSARHGPCRRLAGELRPLPAKRSLARNLGDKGGGRWYGGVRVKPLRERGGGSALVVLRWWEGWGLQALALQAGAEVEALLNGSKMNYCCKGLGDSWSLLWLGLMGW